VAAIRYAVKMPGLGIWTAVFERQMNSSVVSEIEELGPVQDVFSSLDMDF